MTGLTWPTPLRKAAAQLDPGPFLIGLLVGIAVALLGWWQVLSPVTDAVYDLQFALRGDQVASTDIVLIEIDQQSIAALGTFPWPRSIHAQVVERLNHLGARAIAFDFSFHDETPDDELFAQTCASAGNVYIPVRANDTEIGLEYQKPPEAIVAAVQGLGHILITAAADQEVERMSLDYGDAREGYFSTSLLMALAGLGISPAEVLPLRAGAYRVGPLVIPVRGEREVAINYVGLRNSFTTLSYASVLAADWEARCNVVSDKLVLIGVTAPGQARQYRTPLPGQGQVPDLLIHANALDTLLRQRFLRFVQVPWGLMPVLLMIWVVVLDALPKSARWLASLGSMTLLLLITPALFLTRSLFFDPMPWILALGLSYALLAYRYVARRAQRLRAYAPSHVADDDQRHLGPEGVRQHVAVLFADLKSFTALAEEQAPESLYRLMKQCIQILVEETYRMGGTIDKFTGDGVMALFGVPTGHQDDALRAVRAAINMQRGLMRFNQAHGDELPHRLALRVGINFGPVVIGSIGSDERMDYTAMGDTVNVAARLEQMAEAGTVLISQEVLDAAGEAILAEPMGSVHLRNRHRAVMTYRVDVPGP